MSGVVGISANSLGGRSTQEYRPSMPICEEYTETSLIGPEKEKKVRYQQVGQSKRVTRWRKHN